MDAGFLHGLWTAVLLAVFVAIVVWAWSGRRRRDFDEAARLPLEEDSGGSARLPKRGPKRGPERGPERGARHG